MHSNPQRQPTVMIEIYGVTDIGRERKHNEDAFVVFSIDGGARAIFDDTWYLDASSRAVLFMVADGMGGAAAGEVASAIAVESVVGDLRTSWRNSASGPEETHQFAESLRQATEAANTAIFRYASTHAENQGMGTTATIVIARHDRLFVSQVGDSRAYLAREGTVRQLTRDQSLMQRLIEAGELTREQAAQSERRNIILQALGPEPTVKSDISSQQIRNGDVLLLCSDGLSGQVHESDMENVLAQSNGMRDACERLVALANERGGPDNVTVIAARFTGAGLNDPVVTDEVGYLPVGPREGDGSFFSLRELIDDREVAIVERNTRDGYFGNAGPRSNGPLLSSDDSAQQEDSELHRSIIYAVLAAAAIGIATILYRRFMS